MSRSKPYSMEDFWRKYQLKPFSLNLLVVLLSLYQYHKHHAKLLLQRVTITLGIKGERKLEKEDIPKIIELVHSFLMKKGFLINDNMVYCLLTFMLIEGDIHSKYDIDYHSLLQENINNKDIKELLE